MVWLSARGKVPLTPILQEASGCTNKWGGCDMGTKCGWVQWENHGKFMGNSWKILDHNLSNMMIFDVFISPVSSNMAGNPTTSSMIFPCWQFIVIMDFPAMFGYWMAILIFHMGSRNNPAPIRLVFHGIIFQPCRYMFFSKRHV